MTWVKLDDQFPDHPKVIAAGGDAAWLYVAGLCYCQAKLTDGHIPRGIVVRLTDRRHPLVLANQLVKVGLWEEDADGFRVHDFMEYNLDSATVKAKKDANRNRVTAWRKERGGNAVRNAVTTDVRTQIVHDPASASASASKDQRHAQPVAERVTPSEIEAVYARAYPRKEGKTRGLAKLARQIKTPADLAAFGAAVDNFAAKMRREKREPQHVMHFATFAGEWREHVPVAPVVAAAVAAKPKETPLELLRAPRPWEADEARERAEMAAIIASLPPEKAL